MKDLEKIKSEDLGCQVQDANPGNFAIEQEVAQLVGATVPAPTEPSADDARELGAQLLVFLRRALLPIQSALRTAVADIYDHLDSRCTDYTPAAYAPYSATRRAYDPMGTLPARSVANLLTAITAFSDRKISGVPEAADGMSIVQLLLTANTYTELKDNTVWGEYQEGYGITNPNTLSKMLSQFPSVTKLSVGWSKVTAVTTPGSANIVISNSTLTSLDCYALKEVVQNGQGAAFSFPNAVVDFSKLEKFSGYSSCHANGNAGLISRCANETLDFANLQSVTSTGSGSGSTGIVPIASSCTNLKRVLMPKMPAFASDNRIGSQYQIYYFWKCPNIEEIEVGTLTSFNSGNMFYSENNSPLLKLKKVVIGEGTAINLNFAYWEPSAETIAHQDFLPNFKEHIALRLTDQGSGLTLTISQAVFDTIWNQDGTPKSTDPDSVIYQINKIIKTDKHWSVNRA